MTVAITCLVRLDNSRGTGRVSERQRADRLSCRRYTRPTLDYSNRILLSSLYYPEVPSVVSRVRIVSILNCPSLPIASQKSS